jgi:taurine transport system substrate-binding protein
LSTFSLADDPEVIRIGFFQSPNAALLAKAQGLLQKRFPKSVVQYTRYDFGQQINAAFETGTLDIATLWAPPGTAGLVDNHPYKIFYLHDIVGDSEALVVKNSANIADIASLKGRTIATTFGTTTHFSLLAALKLNGLESKDIKLLNVPSSIIPSLWVKNEIDGAYTWLPITGHLLDDGGDILITTKELAELGSKTCEFDVVSDEFYNKYPEVINSYIEILDGAAKQYRDFSPETITLLAAELGLSEEDATAYITTVEVLDASDQNDPRYLGTTAKPGAISEILKQTADYLVEQKVIVNSPPKEFFPPKILTDLYQ